LERFYGRIRHKELSHNIIGAAMEVLKLLKPGLDEKLYENALVIELRKRGHKVDHQKQHPVLYDRRKWRLTPT